jgi:hypothetical protein
MSLPSRRSLSDLRGTPHLARLLAGLRGRLDRLLLAHAAGAVLLALSGWLVFAFVADWLLAVPRPVRWLHLVVLAALPFAVLAWVFVRHWRRRPDQSGLALLIERAHPELDELLVTAVDLQRGDVPADCDRELYARVLAGADAAAARLDLAGVLAPARPLRLAGAGLGVALALVLAARASPELSGIFLARLLGGRAAWPQRTQLELSIPVAADEDAGGSRLTVQAGPERIDVTVARGNDVPVLVRAVGRVPDTITLHLSEDEELELASSGDGQFRTLLRSCQEDLVFHATGGDDEDGLPVVHLRVLDPPDVRGLAVLVTPPAYSGLAPDVRFDRDVEVLAGSTLAVVALPDPPGARGLVRLLPEDRTLALEPREFPARTEGEPALPGLGFEFEARASLRMRFELVDDSGLENPDPGLFAVEVRADRRPEVELLSPTRGELDVVLGGALRLVARAGDDLGLARLEWRTAPGTAADQWGEPVELAQRALPVRMSGDSALEGAAVLGSTRIEIDQLARAAGLAAGSAVSEGEVYLLEAQARDTRPALADGGVDPEGLGRSGTVRLRVVSPEEFLRRLQDRLAVLRTQAGNAEVLQREKLARVSELLAALESDSPGTAAGPAELAAALTGQRRVEGDLRALERELSGLVEGVLYARLDPDAAGLLETLDARLAEGTSKDFDPAPWRELCAAAAGQRTAVGGLAVQLTAILELALAACEDEARAASAALEEAAGHEDLERVHESLTAAAAAQRRALLRVDELIARLSEWDNFQSVLNLARDILQRQKALRDRTKESLDGR